MKPFLLLSFALSWGQALFGGQSLQGFNTFVAANVTGRSHSLPARVEFYFHDWPTNPPINNGVANADAVGINVQLINSNGIRLQVYNTSTGGPFTNSGLCQIGLDSLPTRGVYVRYQHDPSIKTDSCEMWDVNGNRFSVTTWTYTIESASVSNGAQVGGGGNMAFFRICSDLLPMNSRLPVTADTSTTKLLEWKFDGDLTDSSGNGWTASLASGVQPAYVATPNQNVLAVLKTANAPSWNNWASLRAGFPGQLDGTASLSQDDRSATVTCFWQSLSGPSTLTWSNQASCSPTVTGLVFGTYNFQLVATDRSGRKSIGTMPIGAVAMDNNGIVVNADPKADLIYGPMIGFGKNPWGFQDSRAITATTLRSAAYDASGLASPTWLTARPGTVSYQWNPWGAHATTLNAPLSNTATSLVVTDASKVDLTELPTFIVIGTIGDAGHEEEIKICSASATTGIATLTVCYDGRGQQHRDSGGAAWGSGERVTQTKMIGSGTSFLSTICPAGPGWNGPVQYRAGTITLTAGSTAGSGTGTAWTTANSVIAGYSVRVSATHGGGIPFTFFAHIGTVSSPTALILARPYPADADSGTFAYSIISSESRNIVAHYTRSDGTDGLIYFPTTQCGSDTSVYLISGWDIAVYTNMFISGKPYSYMDGFGYVGDFGVNFYDEGLAHYALYLRSGWKPALDAFRKLEGQEGTANLGWLWYPELAQGDAGGVPRRMSITGAFVAAALDGKSSNWSGLRSLANIGAATANTDCDNTDVRESAYQLSWLALAASLDPDPTRRAGWITQLGPAYQRDNGCKTSDNSWKSGEYFNFNTPPLTMTNGSANVTGTGILSSICQHAGTATGLTVTSGSDIVTGTGFVPGAKISINGFVGGVPKYLSFDYILDNPGQIHLSGMWPGASANGLTGYMDSDDFALTFAQTFTDPQLAKNWSCTWVDSGHLTLDRPWDGPTSSAIFGYRANLAGRGQQPFILGIKTLQMSLASKVNSAPLNTNYGTLANLAANWIKDTGFDPATGGLYYGRILDHCEPVFAPSSQPAKFLYRNPQCAYSTNTDSSAAARALNAEAQNAMRVAYENSPTNATRAFGDQFYGSQWGAPGFTQPGFYSDGNIASNLTDGDLRGHKWTGFFFGVGMSHQWPAVRLGGVKPAAARNIAVAFNLAGVPSATTFRILLETPSGGQTSVACPSSPCIVTADARQGSHLIRLQYLDASSRVLAQSSQTASVLVQ